MKTKLKVGFIGSGNIAPYHIASLKKNNFDICNFYSRNYNKALKFSKDNNIVKPTKSFEEFVKKGKNCDLFVIVVKTEAVVKYLSKIFPLKKYTLIEKPGTLNFKKLVKFSNSKVFIGYNRRFYNIIIKAKYILQKHTKFTCVINLTEPSNKGLKIIKLNSIHILDLCFFLFGKLKILNISKSGKSKLNNFSINLHDKNKNLIIVNFLFDAPINQSINIFFDKQLLKLEPIEKLSIKKDFNVLAPSKKISFKRYIPKLIKSEYVKSQASQKPGFQEQYKELRNLIENNTIPKFLCSVKEGISNLKFIEKILKKII
jgi:predicted dehydrogenase